MQIIRPLIIIGCCVALAVSTFLVLRMLIYNRPVLVKFDKPQFKLGWDLKHSVNSSWKVEEKHSGNDGHFILYIPSEAIMLNSIGLCPELKLCITDKTSSDKKENWWSAYLPLNWDGISLTRENPEDPPESFYIFGGKLESSHRITYESTNCIKWIIQLRYVHEGRVREPVDHKVSLTVEIRKQD